MSYGRVYRTILFMDTTYIFDKPGPSAGSWAALAIAILGDLLPLAAWLYLADRYGDELAWQEGIGFFVLVGLLLLLILAEAVAFSLASRLPRDNRVAEWARRIAGGSLFLFGLAVAYLIVDLLIHLPIPVIRIPMVFFIVLIVIGAMVLAKVVWDRTIDPGC